MNFNTSPLAFYPSKNAQSWRRWFAQRKICVICGNDLMPFYIVDSGAAPSTGELFEPNTGTKVADITLTPYLIDHDITVDGQSAHIWLYQGGLSGVFGHTTSGYYYMKIGSWYSDIFKIGNLPADYVELTWQFYDDVFCANGEPISKHVVYKQIFDTSLWHPSYNVEEEGKTNNGIFFAMQQTTKKTSGFSTIVDEEQLDCLNLTRMADIITIKAVSNGTTKTMQTNQFEISSKWESDDVASINCEFDLFNIVRKYQQSNVAPEPIPIDVPPTPPGVYKILGYSDLVITSAQIKVNGAMVTVPVESGTYTFSYTNPLTSETVTESYTRCFEYTYNEPITSFEITDGNIKALDFSQSCNLINATSFKINNGQLRYLNVETCTFAALTTGQEMFTNSQIKGIYIPLATFANVTNAEKMFAISPTHGMNYVVLPLATFANVTNTTYMFFSTTSYTSATIDMPMATFEKVTTANDMFHGFDLDGKGSSFPSATFAALKNCTDMFNNSMALADNFVWSTYFPSSTMEPTNTTRMFRDASIFVMDLSALNIRYITNASQMFQNCSDTTSLAVGNGYWAFLENASNMFDSCKTTALQTLCTTLQMPEVTNTSSMFKNMQDNGGLTFTIATFSKVTNVEKMFEGGNLTSVSMPEADFLNNHIKNVNNMFYNCSALTTVSMPKVKLDYLNANNVKVRQNMFNVCPVLANIDLSVNDMVSWNISYNFEFELKLQSLTKASFINIMNGTQPTTLSGNTNTMYVVVLSSWFNSFSLSDKASMLAALKSGWDVKYE